MISCVGRYPLFANQGDRIGGSSINEISSHARSLLEEVCGMANSQPPISVAVNVSLSGVGNFGIKPTFEKSATSRFEGNQEPSIITEKFLSENSFPQLWVIFGFIPAFTCS